MKEAGNKYTLHQCERKATIYRRLFYCSLALCIGLAIYLNYAIIQWKQQEISTIRMSELYNITQQDKEHYIQQWINTVVERNEYQDLYHDCQNQSKNRWE